MQDHPHTPGHHYLSTLSAKSRNDRACCAGAIMHAVYDDTSYLFTDRLCLGYINRSPRRSVSSSSRSDRVEIEDKLLWHDDNAIFLFK
ncbi:hypothetical protein PISMIDRAFT_690195 [Pisolithus microcarpus 441]|uniref:Uncharacterized protein n=1 Tax=Pisolithus microcarpus 441 TaxID=765257 RepID=A0A0C9XH53_9AGAM|nr:hypothetical protein PISMIDRAFT_690195 [Pisolithus microcarpus 441]